MWNFAALDRSPTINRRTYSQTGVTPKASSNARKILCPVTHFHSNFFPPAKTWDFGPTRAPYTPRDTPIPTPKSHAIPKQEWLSGMNWQKQARCSRGIACETAELHQVPGTPRPEAAAWPAGPGRASSRRASPHASDTAPPVWRAPEGPEGTGGLRDRPLRAFRLACGDLAGGRALRRPEHQRRHKHRWRSGGPQPQQAAPRAAAAQ